MRSHSVCGISQKHHDARIGQAVPNRCRRHWRSEVRHASLSDGGLLPNSFKQLKVLIPLQNDAGISTLEDWLVEIRAKRLTVSLKTLAGCWSEVGDFWRKVARLFNRTHENRRMLLEVTKKRRSARLWRPDEKEIRNSGMSH